VLHAAACYMHGILWRDKSVSSNQLNMPIWSKQSVYIHLKTPNCRKISFHRLTQFSWDNNVLYSPASNIDCFLYKDTCVSSTYLIRPI
jgi:hypothetical protein